MEPTPKPVPKRQPASLGWTLVWGALLAIGVALLVSQGVREARQSLPVRGGQKAPAFTLEKYGGGKLSLSELRGKVVMLDFWATWCPPCRAEMPDLVKLAKTYEKDGLVFVAASQDDPGDAKVQVGLFLSRTGLKDLGSHVVFANDATSDSYKIQVLPTMYFIGRDGQILDAYTSYAAEGTIRQRIERALRESQS